MCGDENQKSVLDYATRVYAEDYSLFQDVLIFSSFSHTMPFVRYKPPSQYCSRPKKEGLPINIPLRSLAELNVAPFGGSKADNSVGCPPTPEYRACFDEADGCVRCCDVRVSSIGDVSCWD